jgi:hypothetical protein
MATIRHPITGVELNPIAIERKALNFDEAVTAHILRAGNLAQRSCFNVWLV